jgi:hypothetical protein
VGAVIAIKDELLALERSKVERQFRLDAPEMLSAARPPLTVGM